MIKNNITYLHCIAPDISALEKLAVNDRKQGGKTQINQNSFLKTYCKLDANNEK